MAGISLRFIAPRILVLLGLFAFGLTTSFSVGCVSETGPGTPDDPDKPPPDSVAAPEAFFVLHGSDIRAADFPAAYVDYHLFVCDPSLSDADIADVRRLIPGVVLIAYTNMQDIPLGFYVGNPYYDSLAAVFDSSFCVKDLVTGDVVCQQGFTGVPGTGMPHYIVREASAEILVAFHRDVTMARDWDGLYLDQSNALYPPWRRAILEDAGSIDTNSDGVAETIAEAEFQYRQWRPFFTARLRDELGPDAIVIANSGGPLGDDKLNGLTLEGVGDRFTVEEGSAYMLEQKAVSRTPFFGVFWGTTPASEQPSRDLALEIPGVHYGVIDPDG